MMMIMWGAAVQVRVQVLVLVSPSHFPAAAVAAVNPSAQRGTGLVRLCTNHRSSRRYIGYCRCFNRGKESAEILELLRDSMTGS